MLIDLITYDILYIILVSVIIFFSFFSIYGFIDNQIHIYKYNRSIKKKEEIHAYFKQLIEQKKGEINITLLKKIYYKFQFVLSVLEEFDKTEKSEAWYSIKKTMAEQILLPKVRKFAYSKNALKRHYASRCFFFFPLQEDEEHILNLLSDSSGINRYLLSKAAVLLGTVQSLEAVLKQMVNDVDTFQFVYNDALEGRTDKVTTLLFQKLQLEERPLYRTRYIRTLKNFNQKELAEEVVKDLESGDLALKLEAMKVIELNFLPSCLEILKRDLKDSRWEVRKQAIKCLALSSIANKQELFVQYLNDSAWEVRLVAAKQLAKLGDEGKDIINLKKQSSEKNVSEVCNYILALLNYKLQIKEEL